MNADAFRHFYNYHFHENRKLWDSYIIPLSFEQFTQHSDYSHGSVRDQVVHMISADDVWFSQLRGAVDSTEFPPVDFDDRDLIRTHWDRIEGMMRETLENLRDDMLFTKPFPDHEEDHVLTMWQTLLHVVNHGTDHRAQLLRQLSDLGVKTAYQDYIFYTYEHL
jgi:uncharacterized damage-inducible protein DinB